MAKLSKGGESTKTIFGKRKKGKAQKSVNKHNRKSRTYQGQGR